MSRYSGLALLFAGLLVAACGGNESDNANNGNSNNGTSNNSSSNNGASNNGTPNNSSSNNGTSNNGTGNNATANNNVGNNSTVDPDAGMPDDAGTPDAGFEEPDDSTHSPGFWPPARYTDLMVRSGSRLTANAVVSEEGNASLLSFDDAATGEECIVRPTEGGEWYCLPTRALGSQYATQIYADADCTMGAVAMTGPTCANGVTVVMTDDYYAEDDEPVERVVRLSKASGRAFRKLNNGTCEPLPTSRDLSAWTVTEEVPLAEYVKFSNHLLPVDDKLAVHLLRGEDGSRAAAGLWLREWDAAAMLIAPDYNTPQVLRALPADSQYYDLDPDRARNFVNGPLVNLSCDSFTNSGHVSPGDPSVPFGVLLPTGQAPPAVVRTGFQGVALSYEAYHTVEDTTTRYCSVPSVPTNRPGISRQAYELREEVEVPEGYTLHRLSVGTLVTSFPRVEQTIDTRAGGLRFAHYETVLRVPLMPVGRERNKVAPTLYRDGGPLGSFWVDGVLRAAVPFEDNTAERYLGEIRYWSDGACTQPLGENGEGRVQTLTPYTMDVCGPRGAGVGVYVNEAAEQMLYSERSPTSDYFAERGCRAGNNGNPGWRNPVRRLTLPDPLIIDVPLAQR